MNLSFVQNIAAGYKNPSQKIRVMSEEWTLKNIFCPFCSGFFKKAKNNARVLDFICANDKCNEYFELKSSKNKMGSKVMAGAYRPMREKLRNGVFPNFFFLKYDYSSKSVTDFIAVPSFVFSESMIEERKRLSPSAVRHDWVGCNILTKNIPDNCKIYYVRGNKECLKRSVAVKWKKILFLKQYSDPNKKSWITDIIKCIELLKKREFSIKELYDFESDLARKHPENKHIKEKIRQKLQLLRDNKYLDFVSKGFYKLK